MRGGPHLATKTQLSNRLCLRTMPGNKYIGLFPLVVCGRLEQDEMDVHHHPWQSVCSRLRTRTGRRRPDYISQVMPTGMKKCKQLRRERPGTQVDVIEISWG